MRTAPNLTQDQLQALLHYCPETGVFTWKHRPAGSKQWNTRYAGKAAGFDWTLGTATYRSIRIFDWPFLGHRLAWFYMTGGWPALVDHRDNDGLNNRWGNLREATKAQNACNSRIPKTNSTGFKGVSQVKKTGRYRAYITHDGKQINLGHFASIEEAHSAYARASRGARGEFARLS